MSRTLLALCAVVLLGGCRLVERDAVLTPLPEGRAFSYEELIARARSTAATALEAFYVDNWPALDEAAVSLEQTARLLPKSLEPPVALKDRLGSESEVLRQDAVKLGDAARGKNAKTVNEALQRINVRIRDLRPPDNAPSPMLPPKIETTSVLTQPEPEKKILYKVGPKVDPNGTGRFYQGREIAPVMSFHGAGWLERPEREQEEETSKLLPPLKIKVGDSVVDMGSGSGYYTVRLSEIVGARGKVFAVDVQPEMLEILGKRLKKEKIDNVALVKGTETDPKLPASSVDLILMVDVYHEFTHPYEMTEAMVKSLKPDGRLVFVEFRLEDEKVPILTLHRMAEKQVRKEMAPFALRHVETQKHLPWQHVIIFEKKAAERKAESTDKEVQL
jgi:ubiquinone/menaquinone biosynthesis C-methylase UbiE